LFAATLERRGINATVRRELGSDISAACGQLRRNHTTSAQPPKKESEADV
ncbi:MAG: 23S rRNA (adenine(2503)-C(2))-methyltransferase RlmN, partial [Angelakisella sp.]